MTAFTDPHQGPRLAVSDGLSSALIQAAAQLQLPMSPMQAGNLLAFLGLLQLWNATYNLTSVRDPAAMLSQHVADCLAVIAPLRRYMVEERAQRFLDVGSGGGLPGVVVAVMCPKLSVVCVDAVGKKAAFVRQVAAELRLNNLEGEHARVEAFDALPFDFVASRAFASLADFTKLTRRHLAPGAIWVAMKGKSPDAEVVALPADVAVFHVEQLAVPGLDAARCLVWMKPEPAAQTAE